MPTETTPEFDLEGKTVLVTGASRGIGRACALACAGSGADLIVGIRKSEDGEALKSEIEGQAGARSPCIWTCRIWRRSAPAVETAHADLRPH